MPVVPLQCPLCTGAMQIDSAWGGQQVACPQCHGLVALPPESALLAMFAAPPTEAAATLHCPICSGPFQVGAHLAGQQVGCPHCGNPMIVPAMAAGPPRETDATAEQPPMRQQPATIDELLPPGAAAASAPAPTEPIRTPPRPAPSSTTKADDRFPPGYRPPAREQPPLDRYPPATVRPSPQPEKKEPLDERLPPARPRQEPSPPAERREPPPKAPKVDVADLLPPGAAAGTPSEAAGPLVSAPTSPLEPLLPPGAADLDPSVPQEQVPIPAAPKKPLNLPPGAIAVPTEGGEMVVIAESPTTVGSGDEAVEVRRLSPEEKARRRFRRNAILWTICILILLVALYFFTR